VWIAVNIVRGKWRLQVTKTSIKIRWNMSGWTWFGDQSREKTRVVLSCWQMVEQHFAASTARKTFVPSLTSTGTWTFTKVRIRQYYCNHHCGARSYKRDYCRLLSGSDHNATDIKQRYLLIILTHPQLHASQ